MALIWEKQADGTRYQVRTAGRTRRLYTNGVFHSQYNNVRPLTGHVWDLLLLPAFFYPAGAIRRVLVLGVGGGAVIRLLRRFVAVDSIVGVELSPLHVFVARRFFGVDSRVARLEEADARDWVERYDGPRFDMIVDDLFGEEGGEPVRVINMNAGWFRILLRQLAPQGLLVANFASPAHMRECAYFSNRQVASRFECAFQLTTPLDENAVGAFLRRASNTRMLRANLRGIADLNPDRKSTRLRYRVRTVTVQA